MDFLLKQRLVGAIVLVALGVIFIPMLLEGPDRNLVPDVEPLPEPAERRISQPLGSFAAPGGIPHEPEQYVVQAEPEPLPARENDQAESSAEIPLPVPEPPPEPEKAEPEQTQVKAGSPDSLANWVVQVGSFSSEQNALRLRDKLRSGGFVTQVEKVRVDAKEHFRVRVGPYLERSEADRDLKKLIESFDLKPRVLSYP